MPPHWLFAPCHVSAFRDHAAVVSDLGTMRWLDRAGRNGAWPAELRVAPAETAHALGVGRIGSTPGAA